MAISTLQLSIAAEKAVQAAIFGVAPLKAFATSFRAAESTKGAAVRVPLFESAVAGEFNESTNNYASDENGVAGVDINLNIHLTHGCSYTDREFAECDVAFWTEAGIAIGNALSKGMVAKALSAIATAKSAATEKCVISATAKRDAIAKAAFAAAADADFDPGQGTLLLNPAYYGLLVSQMTALEYGGTEAIRQGKIPEFMGFKVFCSNQLGSTLGYVMHDEAVGIAGRPLEAQSKAVYEEVGFKTDDTSGLTIGFRRHGNPATGRNHLAGEMLAGVSVIQPTKIVKILDS